MVRTVASLTTIPNRINTDTLLQVLKSIKNQTIPVDDVYLVLPKYCKKTNQEYPPASEEVKSYCKIVQIETDYGPICKVLGGLIEETDPDAIIITCDDDVILPPTMFEFLINKSTLFPKAAIASTGICIGSFPFYLSAKRNENSSWWNWWVLDVDKNIPTPVDIVCGYSSVLYRKGFFGDDYETMLKYADESRDLFLNDDILISGWLSRNNVPRYIFNAPIIIDNLSGPDALSMDTFKFTRSAIAAVKICEQLGMFRDAVKLTLSGKLRTVTALPIIVAVIIILGILMRKSSKGSVQSDTSVLYF